jgi:hypothetical protein
MRSRESFGVVAHVAGSIARRSLRVEQQPPAVVGDLEHLAEDAGLVSLR